MKLIDKTGVDAVEDYQLEVAAQKLRVKYTGKADVIAEVGNILFSAKIQTSEGTKTNIPKMPLLDLLEMAGSNEGFVKVDLDAKTIEGTIELSNSGALDLGTVVMMLSLNNMLPEGRIEINSVDNFMLTRDFITYEPIHFNANVPKEINVAKFYQLGVPVAAFDFIEMKVLVDEFGNTRTVRYTKDEIANICDEINEISFLVANGQTMGTTKRYDVIPGYSRYYNLPIANVLTAKISLTADSNIYEVRNDEL